MKNEVATVVHPLKVQTTAKPVGVFRWQKYVDGNGQLWVVTCLFGHFPSGRYGANVELLNVDAESTVDVTRAEFDEWVRQGNLKRVDTPILL
ncbi:hypothetical protein GCM10028819_33130 [Spirosoma humi]